MVLNSAWLHRSLPQSESYRKGIEIITQEKSARGIRYMVDQCGAHKRCDDGWIVPANSRDPEAEGYETGLRG